MTSEFMDAGRMAMLSKLTAMFKSPMRTTPRPLGKEGGATTNPPMTIDPLAAYKLFIEGANPLWS